MCAASNRATLSMGGSSWCRQLHTPSHTSHTKRQGWACSCRGVSLTNEIFSTRHQGFYVCAINIFSHLSCWVVVAGDGHCPTCFVLNNLSATIDCMQTANSCRPLVVTYTTTLCNCFLCLLFARPPALF